MQTLIAPTCTLLLALVTCIACERDDHATSSDDAAHDAALPTTCPKLTVYRDQDGDDVGFGERFCVDRVEMGFAVSGGDCAPEDPERFAIYSIDRDGDDRGDPSESLCAGGEPPAGFVRDGLDCDDGDAQRAPGFYERYDDGVDSSCDDLDDPTTSTRACSCELQRSLAMPADVVTRCAMGFDPADAAAIMPTLDFTAARTCADRADLAIGFAVQCPSECSEGPIYFSVTNIGGERSTATAVSVTGRFHAGPPGTPIAIGPLDPGASSALIEVTATGTFSLVIEADAAGECDTANNALDLIVTDFHCGFVP